MINVKPNKYHKIIKKKNVYVYLNIMGINASFHTVFKIISILLQPLKYKQQNANKGVLDRIVNIITNHLCAIITVFMTQMKRYAFAIQNSRGKNANIKDLTKNAITEVI